MSEPFRRLVPLAPGSPGATGSGADRSGGAALTAASAGAKAAGLAAAMRAGFPVLPGWLVPVAAGRPALAAATAAVRERGMAAGRREVLRRQVDPVLAEELREAVTRLGGRVIVRSSSPLEADPRWSGAFSSITGVGSADVVTAVRSCWSSAFAVDPLERLESSGLALKALELAVLLQPEIDPAAGGTARVACGEVAVEAVAGHPGVLLSGWADSLSMPELLALIGRDAVNTVAGLARDVSRKLGDDTIEWAVSNGRVWLLQTLRTAGAGRGAVADASKVTGLADTALAGTALADTALAGTALAGTALAGTAALRGTANLGEAEGQSGTDVAVDRLVPRQLTAPRDQMPLLAAAVAARGRHIPARPAAPGTAAGRLVACRPHERPPDGFLDAILLVDRPVPALAPLLFGARGIIARTGGSGSHLAEVARSLGVPMVTGCRLEMVTGTATAQEGHWLAAIDGSTGDVAILAG